MNLIDDAGWTALFFACQYGNLSVVKMLLSAGADPNMQGLDGICCLFLAVQNGHILIVEELVLANADVDLQVWLPWLRTNTYYNIITCEYFLTSVF